jgi:hypothetical protein
MCDRDAQFTPADLGRIPALLHRGINAGLVGEIWERVAPRTVWSVSDEGRIFEGRITNPDGAEYHGYPVLRGEAIAELVYKRFAAWAQKHGNASDKNAAQRCKKLYRFR